jgi:hypothetical protein
MDNHSTSRPKQGPENSPPTDETGTVVNVVERDIRDQSKDKAGVDKVITPSSARVKEQDAEQINKKTDEVEQKLADD